MFSFLVLIFFLTFLNNLNASCPNGSVEWQTKCYYFLKNESAFVIAEEKCISLGGYLTSIHDGFTNNFIAQNAGLNFRESTETEFWIGLSDEITPGNWTWTDGSNLTFTEWNHTKNLTGEDCAAQSISDGRWDAEDCFKLKPFVCAVSSIPTNPPYVNCGNLWFYLESTGYCYGGVYGQYSYTWEDAEIACEKVGSHLASVHSDDELNFISSMVGVDWKWFWIGLYSIDRERSWKWTDNTTVDYFHWETNKPSLNTSACVVVDGGFIDYDCKAKFQVMCKRKP
uniref:C-type lectin domain-containing protein n=1 Tax=Panagrolaimus davidi TaxID=227884 RepID=A0A914QLM9_9BILA